MKTTLIMMLFAPIILFGQNIKNDSTDNNYEKVKSSVVLWADSTFRYYEGARFKTYKIIYSDDYIIAKLRERNLDRDLTSLKAQYQSGEFSGTDDFYKRKYRMLVGRKQDAKNNLEVFQNKINSFYVVFCTNLKLVTGIFNYTEFQVILDDNYRVVRNTLPQTSEEKRNSKILFR